MIYGAERRLREAGELDPPELREQIDSGVVALRQALGDGEPAVIRDRIGELSALVAQLADLQRPASGDGAGEPDEAEQPGDDAEEVPETGVGA